MYDSISEFSKRLTNASYHHTRSICRPLENHSDHVFVVWLPRYRPQLNLIEGLWGFLKRSPLNNYFYGKIESLGAAIHQVFKELQQYPEIALSLAYKTNESFRNTA